MKYCIYLRVSTDKQGVKGLGIEGQRADILRHIGEADIVGEFVESESGMNDNRPELERAVQLCEQTGATLVFAKLDRLGRDAAYLFQLRKRIKILDVSYPDDDPLLFSVRAGMAESERNKISERTSKALQAKIAKDGKYVNNPDGRGIDAAVKKSIEARRVKSENNIHTRQSIFALEFVMKHIRNNDIEYSWQGLADLLNENGFRSPNGGLFSKGSLYALYQRRHSFEWFKLINLKRKIC